MKATTHQAVFSLLFIILLFIPMLFVNLYGGLVSELENRLLAERPPVAYMFEHPRDFIRQFDNWFSDNLGFRKMAINLYKMIIGRLENQVQYSDGKYIMLIGEQGHHFFANENGWMISKFQGKAFLSDEQLIQLTRGLNEVKSFLDDKGIPFIVMFCADKETIYPEYYPKSIKRGPEPDQLDIITEYVKRNTTVDLFNIKECLLLAKEHYPVFDKKGNAATILSHYNEIGAFISYQELMVHIRTYFPDMVSFTFDDVTITFEDKGIYPNIPNVLLKQDITYQRLDESFFNEVSLKHPSQGVAFENLEPSLPRILMLRDSYTGDGYYLSIYIPQHFGQTILIHWSNMPYLQEYIEKFNPDIVVFESAERELGNFANAFKNVSFSE